MSARSTCPACKRASIDSHDRACTRGVGCVERPKSPGLAWDPPPPADPIRALEEAVRVARASSHERRLEPPVARAFRAYDDVLVALIDLVHVRDRELASLRDRVRQFIGDP